MAAAAISSGASGQQRDHGVGAATGGAGGGASSGEVDSWNLAGE